MRASTYSDLNGQGMTLRTPRRSLDMGRLGRVLSADTSTLDHIQTARQCRLRMVSRTVHEDNAITCSLRAGRQHEEDVVDVQQGSICPEHAGQAAAARRVICTKSSFQLISTTVPCISSRILTWPQCKSLVYMGTSFGSLYCTRGTAMPNLEANVICMGKVRPACIAVPAPNSCGHSQA